MIDMNIKSHVRLKRLENLMNTEVKIFVGYPEGKYADIARYLIEGTKGAKHKGWDFLNDGIKSKISELRLLIKEKYIEAKNTGHFDGESIGGFCVQIIQDFVNICFSSPNQNSISPFNSYGSLVSVPNMARTSS